MIKQRNGLLLGSSEIMEQVITDLDCMPIPNRPKTFVSADFGELSEKSIVQTLKEVFGHSLDKS